MAVRLAEADDLMLVERLTRDAYARYKTEIGIVPGPVHENYAPRIARGDIWLLTGADHGVVGLIVLEARADHLFVFSVAVSPDHQGHGHGLALLRFADARATALGLREVRLYTNDLMTRNIALYERFGYRRTGLRPHPTRAGNAIVDMAKALT